MYIAVSAGSTGTGRIGGRVWRCGSDALVEYIWTPDMETPNGKRVGREGLWYRGGGCHGE